MFGFYFEDFCSEENSLLFQTLVATALLKFTNEGPDMCLHTNVVRTCHFYMTACMEHIQKAKHGTRVWGPGM